MRILIVGLGSMGNRRLRAIKGFFPEVAIAVVDTRKDRLTEIRKDRSISVYNNLAAAFQQEKIDAVFVCTSPQSHKEIILYSLKNDCHVFCELNLDNTWYEEIISLANEKNRKIFLSSTMLYHDDIKWIESKIKNEKSPFSYIYHVGQYLPDWHPWEKPEEYFISNKQTNGCREILAIELPWLDRVFGKITKTKSLSTKLNVSLNLNWNDTRNIILQHEEGIVGSLIVDVVSRMPRRDLKIWGEWGDISWEGKPNSLRFSTEGKAFKNIVPENNDLVQQLDEKNTYSYANIINEKPYICEVHDFFSLINQKKLETALHTLKEDFRILEFINKMEENL